ncbi:hypothetical protein KQX54_005811 [Cotesia glomerata]|uniref:Uncharacterized protein n=1 Tax=Cotesia glomerata TaxID=32391 RepID=A0AAV7IQD8_COTGL|nr:hypothetical protein KQX54_005811 [Cotesia glomerata]
MKPRVIGRSNTKSRQHSKYNRGSVTPLDDHSCLNVPSSSHDTVIRSDLCLKGLEGKDLLRYIDEKSTRYSAREKQDHTVGIPMMFSFCSLDRSSANCIRAGSLVENTSRRMQTSSIARMS